MITMKHLREFVANNPETNDDTVILAVEAVVQSGEVHGATLQLNKPALQAALPIVCEQLETIANTSGNELQMAVDDLCYEEFGDGKSTSHINNQGITYQFEKLAERWGDEEAFKTATGLLAKFA